MDQPHLVARNGRRFAGFAAAVLVFIVDSATERFLMLSSPAKRGRTGWEVVNGAVEVGESIAEAARREVSEEVGPDVGFELLGVVDAWTWRYDDLVPNMISIAFAARYVGGEVVPGDDMSGCEARWMSLGELEAAARHGCRLLPERLSTFVSALDLATSDTGPRRS